MNCLFLTILQFIDAARKYTELSYIVGDAGGHALGKAMICAILADAGFCVVPSVPLTRLQGKIGPEYLPRSSKMSALGISPLMPCLRLCMILMKT